MKGGTLSRSKYLDELTRTLSDLSFAEFAADILVLDESTPDRLLSSSVYASANDRMLAQVDRRTQPLVHVTGEMRAITDPTHQSICQRYSERANPVSILCYVGKIAHRPDALCVLRHSRENWIGIDWKRQFMALCLISEGAVRVSATPSLEPVHFSVFGDKGVLLQSKHDHNMHKKFVWLIEDAQLNDHLRRSAEHSKSRATYISAALFRDALSSISSLRTVDCMIELREGKGTSRLRPEALSALKAIGYVKSRAGTLILTNSGSSFLANALEGS
ncbi:MAG: hypothetical protein EOP84_17635 [Verrucomicrobiaceae bacterium]|nr:MAG: hypothetical protein EOP84_17635 [Verrucomicrobiaceae bacterium]